MRSEPSPCQPIFRHEPKIRHRRLPQPLLLVPGHWHCRSVSLKEATPTQLRHISVAYITGFVKI